MSTRYASPPTDLNDVAVAAALGDRAAMSAVLVRIRPMVLSFCRSRMQGMRYPSAEDITQEVCIAVLRALPRYENRGRFIAFVYGVASHKVVDAVRAVGRDRSVPVETVPDVPTRDDGPEEHALRSEQLQRTEQMLDVLSAQQRTILHLRIIDGRTATDTADALGMTPGAVRVAQHRALTRLREEFATDSRNTKSRNA
ncbi:RNA polymerase sigma factor ShbA [Rhodococcus sp. BE178]|uniref:RNA polymerase sigma factor ShbA n=1 Tax=Rhodococcus sp. BE178 TaxID=2817737 RepID=UPI003D20EEE6